jgi:Fe-S-cluster containining protein
MPNDSIDSVVEVFLTIDARTAAFRLASGLRCPTGCGDCCRSTKVEATVLELLPAAADILRRDEATLWLAALQRNGESGVCAAYCPEPLDASGGHCRLYRWRPSLCRLFGFSAVKDKHGRREPAVCGRMRALMPPAVKDTRRSVTAAWPAPLVSGYSACLAAIDPTMGVRQLPVNRALREAIERMGLMVQLDPGPGANGSTPRMAA